MSSLRDFAMHRASFSYCFARPQLQIRILQTPLDYITNGAFRKRRATIVSVARLRLDCTPTCPHGQAIAFPEVHTHCLKLQTRKAGFL
jgi:hypothetical protein